MKNSTNIAVSALIMVLSLFINGCGPVIGLIVDALPKPPVPAEFDSSGKSVVVYVSSTGNTELGPVFKRELTNRLNDTLLANDAASSTVDYTQISNLKLTATEPLTPEYIGKALKAELVISIEVDRFSADYTETTTMTPGQVQYFVSVIQAADGKRLWPVDQTKRNFITKTRLDMDSQQKLSNSEIQNNLAEETADKIGKLFYKHRPDKS